MLREPVSGRPEAGRASVNHHRDASDPLICKENAALRHVGGIAYHASGA